jgi:hypothetical protein
VKVKVTRVVPQGKVNKDDSNTRTGNKTVVTTEKRRLVEYVTKKDKKHVSVLAKIKKRSASGNFLLGIKKIAQCYNQRHGLKKEQGKRTYPFTLRADTAVLIDSILVGVQVHFGGSCRREQVLAVQVLALEALHGSGHFLSVGLDGRKGPSNGSEFLFGSDDVGPMEAHLAVLLQACMIQLDESLHTSTRGCSGKLVSNSWTNSSVSISIK